VTPDEIIDQQIDDNYARGEWIHNPAVELTDRDRHYIAALRERFADTHANMLACTPDNDYRRRAEEALELAGMLAIKAITHPVAPERKA